MNPFKILGLNPNATYRQGYDRFRYLARKHHPDKGGDADTFRQIHDAWQSIKNKLPKTKRVTPKPTASLVVKDQSKPVFVKPDPSNLRTLKADLVYFVVHDDGYRTWINYIVEDGMIKIAPDKHRDVTEYAKYHYNGLIKEIPLSDVEVITESEHRKRMNSPDIYPDYRQ